MTDIDEARIIPADQWPEGAVALVWDQHGRGKALVRDEPQKSWFFVYVSTPMPAGHDWRVPVMRPTVKDSLTAPPAIDLEKGLRDLYRAYVRLLESGRDRITSLGGSCDPVDVMERSDIDLRKVRDLLALIDGQACSVHASGVYEVSGCPECGELHCCGGNDEDPRSHCMDCSEHPGKPTKDEEA